MQVRLRMVSIWQLRMCFLKTLALSLRTTIEVIPSGFHSVSSNSYWNKIRGNFLCKNFWKSKSAIFFLCLPITFFSLFFLLSAFRNSNLTMKGYKEQRPKTANHIWVVLFKKQLEKTVNTRKMRRTWKVAKMAILLTLYNFSKASDKWPFWVELRNSQNSRKMTLEV